MLFPSGLIQDPWPNIMTVPSSQNLKILLLFGLKFLHTLKDSHQLSATLIECTLAKCLHESISIFVGVLYNFSQFLRTGFVLVLENLERSWNFILAFSRTGKYWKKATGPGKFWKSVKLN